MNICDADGQYGLTHKDHRLTFLQRVVGMCRLTTRNLRHYTNIPTCVLLLGLIIATINLRETLKVGEKLDLASTYQGVVGRALAVTQGGPYRKKQVWVRAKRMETGYLKHVTGVLQSLGYTNDGGTYSDWDLLWSHEYPFSDTELKQVLFNLKPHQKVNKWPGSGYVTSKVALATSVIEHIPKAFALPAREKEFKAYAALHPDTLWVQKSNKHRGIKITAVSGLDLSSSNTFVQQYVDKPLLINKKKFDIGIYTIVTSLEPLRVYIINHDFLLRFCAHEYYPFDSTDRDKYVVTDDYTPIWDIPLLNKYFANGFTAKQSLHQYLVDEGKNADKLYADIESTIRDVYLSKLIKMRESLSSYNHRNFFELVRFDFVVDEEMALYLMEVNMSPNLSSRHFAPNRLLYEQVLYNVFHLVGLASNLDHHSKLQTNEQEMLIGPRDLSVQPAQCHQLCSDGCKAVECRLCYSCMTATQKDMLREAYSEHVNRRHAKRVMPPVLSSVNPDEKPEYWSNLSEIDQTMHLWFVGKCKDNKDWC